MNFIPRHTFHIPVLGIGYSIDSPVKVAHLGITSTVSLVDDILMEKLRAFYCKKYKLHHTHISTSTHDFRTKRITAYLNMMQYLVDEKFNKLKKSLAADKAELKDYLDMFPALPENNISVDEFIADFKSKEEIANWIEKHLVCGSIDVNIMTKLDKPNYEYFEKLPKEYNDALAALRGYAKSDLHSSIVFSAGLNANLYTYIESFPDFFPDKDGYVKKKIILKVSDYRSALIQAKFLAKKGLWVSEFRIESGLYCGGHCFPTQGFLMGPILEEFKSKRQELYDSIYPTYSEALKQKNLLHDANPVEIRVTVQGGISTPDEHRFLLDYYHLGSIGWGTPFLLVPEVTNVDYDTLELLIISEKDDVYLSDISPLNVPFSNLKYNSKDRERDLKINNNLPGSLCPKKYLSFNTEFTENEICVASREYQQHKINELKEKRLPKAEYDKEYNKIIVKSCICVGLGTSALLVNHLHTRDEGKGVSVCPGPNIAYFKKTVSLQRMLDHIYNHRWLLEKEKIPHIFIRELELYIKFLKDKISDSEEKTAKQWQYFNEFRNNLLQGINYYRNLFTEIPVSNALITLDILESELKALTIAS